MISAEERLSEELRPILGKYQEMKTAGIARAVVHARFDLMHQPDKALERALARGLIVREAAKLEEGGNISADQAARRLGISKTSVLEKFKKGQLLGWRETRQKAVRFPVWQFAQDEILAGLPKVLSILSKSSRIDDWGRIMFFLNPRGSLKGKRPLDALREGRIPLVERLAWSDVEP
jgi:hypothetical protein